MMSPNVCKDYSAAKKKTIGKKSLNSGNQRTTFTTSKRTSAYFSLNQTCWTSTKTYQWSNVMSVVTWTHQNKLRSISSGEFFGITEAVIVALKIALRNRQH